MKKNKIIIIIYFLLMILPLFLNCIYFNIFLLINSERESILICPGKFYTNSILISILMCIGIASFVFYKAMDNKISKKCMLIIYSIFFAFPLLFVNDKTVICNNEIYHYNMFNDVQKSNVLSGADEINVTFHNAPTKSFFTNDTISCKLSYKKNEFCFDINMYDNNKLNAFKYICKIAFDKNTIVNIDFGNSKNNIEAQKIAEDLIEYLK